MTKYEMLDKMGVTCWAAKSDQQREVTERAMKKGKVTIERAYNLWKKDPSKLDFIVGCLCQIIRVAE